VTEDEQRYRDEYLVMAKRTALRFLDAGDLGQAFSSMVSSMSQHTDFKGVAEKMNGVGVIYLMNHDAGQLRAWIEGFR
jgi:hypothetical protein